MPRPRKIALVTPVFHPSDIAFVLRWSKIAPGLGGWHVRLDPPRDTEHVAVIPPGSEEPVFVLQREVREVVLRRVGQTGMAAELGRFPDLRRAVMALCPIDDDALQEIHEGLEREFPRANQR